jgi:hypothetical protein
VAEAKLRTCVPPPSSRSASNQRVLEGCVGSGSTVKKALKAGVLYFTLVFAAGFVLGTVRTLWAVPRLGVRMSELMEAPIMLGVSVLAARWAVRHVDIPPLWPRRLAMGCVAPALMLLAEFAVVLWIRGLTIRGYFEARDPASGTVYFLTLGAFASQCWSGDNVPECGGSAFSID